MAFHFNLPVISTNVGGLSEFVKDGENGYLIEKSNADLLADKINDAFQSNNLIKIKKQLSNSQNQHNWQDFSEELIQFLQE